MARTSRFLQRSREIFTIIGAAMAASAAVEGRRQPKAQDLRLLGIDPDKFGRIG